MNKGHLGMMPLIDHDSTEVPVSSLELLRAQTVAFFAGSLAWCRYHRSCLRGETLMSTLD